MIYKAISAIQKKMDEYIRNKYALSEQLVSISKLTDQEELQDHAVQNKLLITLVNIQRETAMGISFKSSNLSANTNLFGRPPVFINFFLLFSANFDDKNYDESLKYLSSALEFIQINDLITRTDTPWLDGNIDRLHLELVNLSFHELSNMWSIFGGKYIPSLLCKVRMLAIDLGEIDHIQIASKSTKIN